MILRVLCLVVLPLALSACGHEEDFNGSERPPPSARIGATCNQDADCDAYCAEGNDFPGGFCSISGCRSNEQCPEGTVCVDLRDGPNDDGVCAYPCSAPLDCTADFLGRGGYTCKRERGFPTATTEAVRYYVCIGN